MGKSGLTVFIKNLKKQKTIALLSISSLGIAIAVVLLVGLWAVEEFTYDNFHKDRGIIFRAITQANIGDQLEWQETVFRGVGEMALSRYPEIKKMCRIIVPEEDKMIKADSRVYLHESILEVDTNFFTFFSFPLKVGDPSTCFSSPDGIVISEAVAERFFPGENPLGKRVIVARTECTVTAVMKNIPENSHLKGEIITPFLGEYKQSGFDSYYLETYFKIPDVCVLPKLETELTGMVTDRLQIDKELQYKIGLQALEEIHFDPRTGEGNKTLVLIFVFIALIILAIACINFINLFISTSFLRAKSIGIKKAYGITKGALIREFYQETFLYVLLAIGLGVFLAIIALPLFNRLINFHLDFSWSNEKIYLFIILVLVGIVFLAGTFPAFFMTKFNVIESLQGKFKGKNLSFLQQGLIVIQFVAAIVIMITVFFIDRQVNYMISRDLGFDKENILYTELDIEGGFGKDFNTFRDEMKRCPAIVDVATKIGLPTEVRSSSPINRKGESLDYFMELCYIADNYFDVMGMKLETGNNFDQDDYNQDYCIINESAAKLLGGKSLLGENIFMGNDKYTIKGIVKDLQTKSFHAPVTPQVYFPVNELESLTVLLFRIEGNPQMAIRFIREKWEQLNPDIPFEYNFLDDAYARLYKTEIQAGQILRVALCITMIISVAGLFAMAFYVTQHRKKEIGVRKVNGASVKGVLLLLNLYFFTWTGIAFLLACPLSYYIVSRWLENFTERLPVSWWVFALAGGIMFLVTLLTVSYQTWKAARVNPIKILHLE